MPVRPWDRARGARGNGRLPRMSRLLRRAALVVVLFLLALGAALVAAMAAALQPEPAIASTAEPSPQDIARVVWLARQHDPRKAVPGAPRSVTLSEGDVELMLNHAARGRLDGATRVHFLRGTASVQSSLHLPANPFGRWLNLDLQLSQTAGLPTLAAVRAGTLPLPPALAEWLLLKAAERKGVVSELRWLAGAAQRVDFRPQSTTVTYAWPADSAERMLAALVPADEVQRLQAYHARIAEIAARQPAGWMAPLVAFVGPLFTLAAERSAAGGDAAAENRAVLTTLTLYANGRGLQNVLPAARQWPPARPLRLTLGGRDDFPLHWLISAATAAERSTLGNQAELLAVQLNNLINDASYNGVNLLKATPDNLQVNFNEDSTVELTVAGSNLTAANLGADISTVTNNWGTVGDINADVNEYASALGQLRTASQTFGSNATLLSTRKDFTEQLVNTLKEGSDKLTLADLNEEGANLLALQTRQQLGINALSLASQSEQAVLSLFR